MICPVLLPLFLLARLAMPEPPFVQTVRDDAGRRLQTGVTEYVHPSGVRVTLVATVHLATPAYYDSIRGRIEPADVVIHEGVRRRFTRPLVGIASPPAGLVRQTDMLPTRGERFVLGDLDEAAFESARDKRVPIAPVPADRVSLADSVTHAIREPQTRGATERAFAILPRNAAAIEVLRHRLTRGDQRIVLLYGASHAPDLDRRLIEEFGFACEQTTWIDAFEY